MFYVKPEAHAEIHAYTGTKTDVKTKINIPINNHYYTVKQIPIDISFCLSNTLHKGEIERRTIYKTSSIIRYFTTTHGLFFLLDDEETNRFALYKKIIHCFYTSCIPCFTDTQNEVTLKMYDIIDIEYCSLPHTYREFYIRQTIYKTYPHSNIELVCERNIEPNTEDSSSNSKWYFILHNNVDEKNVNILQEMSILLTHSIQI